MVLTIVHEVEEPDIPRSYLASTLSLAGDLAERCQKDFGGSQREGLTRDDVLDNITLYWLTNTAVSSARLYWNLWETKLSFFDVKNVSIPVAVSAFPDELYQAPRSWAERAYSKLIHYNKLDKGGHFAAWEQPQLFSEEVRAGFRPLRKSMFLAA
jgi:pimeloyl-ACP methyl ester carboxylesterase